MRVLFEPKPPHRSPFRRGRRYRVVKSFEAERDRFEAGEILIYRRDAYSIYDGLTGYFFSETTASRRMRVWDWDDYNGPPKWRCVFEPLPAPVLLWRL